jgi:hypothetical protein
MKTLKRKLALAFAVALAATAMTTASAQATYYLFTDPDTGAPCTDVVEQSDGTLTGGCVVPMTIDENPTIVSHTCGLHFNMRFGGVQVPNYEQLGEYAIYLEDLDVTGSPGWCVMFTNPIGNWGWPEEHNGQSWRAGIDLDPDGQGGHQIVTRAQIGSTYSERFVLRVLDDIEFEVHEKYRTPDTVTPPPNSRFIHKGKWSSSDGVLIYTASPIDFNF